MVRDGVYGPASGAGYPHITCGDGYAQGTVSAPITVQAEHERQAHLASDGRAGPDTFRMDGRRYWIIEGLYLSNEDDGNGTHDKGWPVLIADAEYITLRRLLVARLDRTAHVLVEECEVYDFTRHGIQVAGHGPHNVLRRNYVNSRAYPGLPGADEDDPSRPYDPVVEHTGDGGITLYPGTENLVENNIVERTANGYWSLTSGAANNHFLGNIAHEIWGPGLRSEVFYDSGPVRGNQAAHRAVLRGLTDVWGGVVSHSGEAIRCDSCTVIDYPTGYSTVIDDRAPVGAFSLTGTTLLAVDIAGRAVRLVEELRGAYTLDHVAVFNDAEVSIPDLTQPEARILAPQFIDPRLGSCLLWLPDDSPLKGAGTAGGDIGATILYRYAHGVLTDVALWRADGSFPCGALVPGVNDVPGASCFDVHERLNVNLNGCPFPAGFRGVPVDDPPAPVPGPETPPEPERRGLLADDMEEGPWPSGSFAGTRPVVSWTTAEHQSGQRSLQVTGSSQYWGYWSAPERVSVNSGEVLEARMWVMTEAIAQGITLNLWWYDAMGGELGWSDQIGGKVTGTTAWQEVSGLVTVPVEATDALVQVRFESTGGVAYVDDVSLGQP